MENPKPVERRSHEMSPVREAYLETWIQLQLIQRRLTDPMPITITDRDILVRRTRSALEALNKVRRK